MTCKEKALSEDYIEIMTDFLITEELREGLGIDLCSISAGQGVYISYVNRATAPRLRGSAIYFTPQCYGLMAETNAEKITEEDLASKNTAGQQINTGQEMKAAQIGRIDNLSERLIDFDTFALADTGILQTQKPPLSLTGRGVVMGFLDTGIRYEDEVFRYADGSTRLLAIWDQTVQSGSVPEGQLFGTEYTRDQINDALQSENPRELVPSTDMIGHGTAMASVAAGSALSDDRFLGAAPDCQIVAVKLRQAKQYLRDFELIPEGVPAYAETDLLLALKYLNSFAVSLRRPLVICIGMGTNKGSHTGDSVLSRYMQNLLEMRSRAIVIAGGNEGNSAHHFEGSTCIRKGDPYEDVEIRVSEGTQGFTAELWGTVPQLFTVSVVSPSGEVFPNGSGSLGQDLVHSFLYERTRLSILYSVVEEGTGDERILLRFEQPSAGLWTLRVYGVGEHTENHYHVWLPIRNFLTAETVFLRPTPYVTLTMPGYTEESITVTVYNDENDSFWTESSRGFGRKGGIKPDLAAPGVRVPTIIGRVSGSSIAAALTAGAAAQFLQWAVVERNDEYVFGRDVANYLIRGAIREDSIIYPSREWGFGRLNIANTFEVLRVLR